MAMSQAVVFFFLLILAGAYNAEASYLESADFLQWVENWETVVRTVREEPELKNDALKRAERLHTATPRIPSIPFECEPQAPGPKPTSVHELRPADIDVVAALGDSITAGHGSGAENLLEVIVPRRGLAFSIGGDRFVEEGYITLANIIKEFNPNVNGYSVCASASDQPRSGFNVAEAGARNVHLLQQAEVLVDRMRDDAIISFDDDWKVVTMFVGGNDLCGYCNNPDSNSPETYVDNYRQALDHLMEHLPRAYINVKVMFDTSVLYNMTDGPFCDFMHEVFCDCVLDAQNREEMREVQLAYYEGLRDLIDSGRYDEKDDFTVVLQPHMRDQEPFIDPDTGNYDMAFVSPDCFHPSEVAHQGFAFMLWNMMLTRVGEKPYKYAEEDYPAYICPTEENPYIFTARNSILPPEPTVDDSATSSGASGLLLTAAGLMASFLTR